MESLNACLTLYALDVYISLPSYDCSNSFPFWGHGGAYAGDDDATPGPYHRSVPCNVNDVL